MAIDDPLVETDDKLDKKIRLLICKTCNTIDPLPDYDGPADYDDTLMGRVGEHQFEGSSRGHELDLGRVSEKSWNDPRLQKEMLAEIGKNVGGSGGGQGLGEGLYAVRDNYMEQAMQCWRFKHGRTSNCDDYMHPKMLLLSDTKADRKAEGLDPKARGRTYLCKFCPMESIVQQRKNKARGTDK